MPAVKVMAALRNQFGGHAVKAEAVADRACRDEPAARNAAHPPSAGTVHPCHLRRVRRPDVEEADPGVEARVPKRKAIHAVVDNYATQKHPKVRNGLPDTLAGPSTSLRPPHLGSMRSRLSSPSSPKAAHSRRLPIRRHGRAQAARSVDEIALIQDTINHYGPCRTFSLADERVSNPWPDRIVPKFRLAELCRGGPAHN